jgi:hypothetical protein
VNAAGRPAMRDPIPEDGKVTAAAPSRAMVGLTGPPRAAPGAASLGLSAVTSLVESCGGSLKVRSPSAGGPRSASGCHRAVAAKAINRQGLQHDQYGSSHSLSDQEDLFVSGEPGAVVVPG